MTTHDLLSQLKAKCEAEAKITRGWLENSDCAVVFEARKELVDKLIEIVQMQNDRFNAILEVQRFCDPENKSVLENDIEETQAAVDDLLKGLIG